MVPMWILAFPIWLVDFIVLYALVTQLLTPASV